MFLLLAIPWENLDMASWFRVGSSKELGVQPPRHLSWLAARSWWFEPRQLNPTINQSLESGGGHGNQETAGSSLPLAGDNRGVEGDLESRQREETIFIPATNCARDSYLG